MSRFPPLSAQGAGPLAGNLAFLYPGPLRREAKAALLRDGGGDGPPGNLVSLGRPVGVVGEVKESPPRGLGRQDWGQVQEPNPRAERGDPRAELLGKVV